MKSRFSGFVWLGLGLSLLMALLLSPYASSSPDGLEKIAQARGFSHLAEERTLWNHAPLRDYTIPWIENRKTSTAFSGLIGTLSIFLTSFGIGKLLRKKRGQ